MIKIIFLKNHKEFLRGETRLVSPNEAFGLIDAKIAKVAREHYEKEMRPEPEKKFTYKTKSK